MIKVISIKEAVPDACNIYIGRPMHPDAMAEYKHLNLKDGSQFGNPFKITEECGRDKVIELYEKYFYDNLGKFESILNTIEKLAKKQTVFLVCWCKPKSCHGDVIANFFGDKEELVTEDIFN